MNYSSSNPLSANRVLRLIARGIIVKTANKIKIDNEMGLLKNIVKFPFAMMSDWVNVFSNKGPSITPKTNGAPSYSIFLKIYPRAPKKSIITMSVTLFPML